MPSAEQGRARDGSRFSGNDDATTEEYPVSPFHAATRVTELNITVVPPHRIERRIKTATRVLWPAINNAATPDVFGTMATASSGRAREAAALDHFGQNGMAVRYAGSAESREAQEIGHQERASSDWRGVFCHRFNSSRSARKQATVSANFWF
jgi:hypothetical protein